MGAVARNPVRALAAALLSLAVAGCGTILVGVGGTVLSVTDSGGGSRGGGAPAEVAPSVVVGVQGNVLNDVVVVGLRLVDPGEEPADVEIEVERASGQRFPASEARLSIVQSSGKAGLRTAPQGADHVFLWNAAKDLPGEDALGVRIVVTPRETATPSRVGAVVRSDPFDVRNSRVAVVAASEALAALSDPKALVIAGAAVLVADEGGHAVLAYDTLAGAVGRLAGTGAPGITAEDILAITAPLDAPGDLALDQMRGAIIVADQGRSTEAEGNTETASAFSNQRILRIDLATGYLTGLVGARPSDPAVTFETRRHPDEPEIPVPAREVDLLPGYRVAVSGTALFILEREAQQIWATPLGGSPISIPDGRFPATPLEIPVGRVGIVAGDEGGALLETAGAAAAALDQALAEPLAVAVGPDGLVYVADRVEDGEEEEAVLVRAWNPTTSPRATRLIDASGASPTVVVAPGDMAVVWRLDEDVDPDLDDELGFDAATLTVDGAHRLYLGDPGRGTLRVGNADRAGTSVTMRGDVIPAGESRVVIDPRVEGESGGSTFAFPVALAVTGTASPPDLLLADGASRRVLAGNVSDAPREILREPVPPGAAVPLPILILPRVLPLGGTRSLALSPQGELLIGDAITGVSGEVVLSRVARLDAFGEVVETLAGTGIPGFAGDGGPAPTARIGLAADLACDARGDLWIADSASGRVRFVNRGQAAVDRLGVTVPGGAIATVLGTGGDGLALEGAGPGAVALDDPVSLAIDPRGALIVGTSRGQVVAIPTGAQAVSLAGGRILLEPGRCAILVSGSADVIVPRLALDEKGGLTILDGGTGAVSFLNLGEALRSVAGVAAAVGGPLVRIGGAGLAAGPGADLGGGTLASARFGGRASLLAGEGLLWIADADNGRLRVVDLDAPAGEAFPGGPVLAPGEVATVAGTGLGGFPTVDGAAGAATLGAPLGLARANAGTVYFGDMTHGAIRALGASGAEVIVAGRRVAPADIATIAGGVAGASRLVRPAALATGRRAGELVIADAEADGVSGRRVFLLDPETRAFAAVVGGGVASVRSSSFARDVSLQQPLSARFQGDLLLVADAGAHLLLAANLGASTTSVLGVNVAPGGIAAVAGNGTTSQLKGNCGDANTIFVIPPVGGVSSDPCKYEPDPDTVLAGAPTIPLGLRVDPTDVAAFDPATLLVTEGFHSRIRRLQVPTSPPPTATALTIVQDPDAKNRETFRSALVLRPPSGTAVLVYIQRPAKVIRRTLAADGSLTGASEVLVNTNGVTGFNGHVRPRGDIRLSQPRALAVDADGDLYIADTGNNRILFVNMQAVPVRVAGVVVDPGYAAKIAGGTDPLGAPTETPGFVDVLLARTLGEPVDEPRPPSNFSLGAPVGVAVDGDGTIHVSEEATRRVVRFAGKNAP